MSDTRRPLRLPHTALGLSCALLALLAVTSADAQSFEAPVIFPPDAGRGVVTTAAVLPPDLAGGNSGRPSGCETDAGRIDQVQAHVLYGHSISRWWDMVAGVRQEFRPGTPQTWVAVGVQGLAPYWFDIEATAYVGEAGRTHLRLETEYELLLTNRLILQTLVEMEMFGKAIPEARVGAGLSRLESGVRLRYEFRRDVAPYVGVTWERRFGATADFAREDRNTAQSPRLAVGLHWFF